MLRHVATCCDLVRHVMNPRLALVDESIRVIFAQSDREVECIDGFIGGVRHSHDTSSTYKRDRLKWERPKWE